MKSNLCPYSVATGEENYYFLAPTFIFIKKDKIDYDTILDGIYVPDSGLKESFEDLELCKNHSNYDYYIFIIYKWKQKKLLNFRNSAVFYDYKNIGIIEELNQVRKCIIKSFIKQFHVVKFL